MRGERILFATIAVLLLVMWLHAAVALAGFDSPLHHASAVQRAEDAAIPGKRCPKASNPIECGSVSGKAHGGSLAQYGERLLPSKRSCKWAEVEYRYHHPVRKPRSLRGWTGCALYRRDRLYHHAQARLGLDDDLQELVEQIAGGSLGEFKPLRPLLSLAERG